MPSACSMLGIRTFRASPYGMVSPRPRMLWRDESVLHYFVQSTIEVSRYMGHCKSCWYWENFILFRLISWRYRIPLWIPRGTGSFFPSRLEILLKFLREFKKFPLFFAKTRHIFLKDHRKACIMEVEDFRLSLRQMGITKTKEDLYNIRYRMISNFLGWLYMASMLITIWADTRPISTRSLSSLRLSLLDCRTYGGSCEAWITEQAFWLIPTQQPEEDTRTGQMCRVCWVNSFSVMAPKFEAERLLVPSTKARFLPESLSNKTSPNNPSFIDLFPKRLSLSSSVFPVLQISLRGCDVYSLQITLFWTAPGT